MSRSAMRLLGAAVLSGLFCSGSARAELQESPQHFAVELKFGPYVPHLDDASWLNGRTPFSDHFGNQADPKGALPSRGLLSMVEFDYQFWRKFGTLGIGLEGGYFAISAPAFTSLRVTDSNGMTTQQACQVSADKDNPNLRAQRFARYNRGVYTSQREFWHTHRVSPRVKTQSC